MMSVLRTARTLNLPGWLIGAGFIRNKVWDHLSGNKKTIVDTRDIDLVYFDPKGNDEKSDRELSNKLKEETGINWEVVNQHYAHRWNEIPPYKSTEDAISTWPETATAIGITLDEKGVLKLIAPYGIDDMVNFIVKPSPRFPGGIAEVRKRVANKKWLEKWPKLKVLAS